MGSWGRLLVQADTHVLSVKDLECPNPSRENPNDINGVRFFFTPWSPFQNRSRLCSQILLQKTWMYLKWRRDAKVSKRLYQVEFLANDAEDVQKTKKKKKGYLPQCFHRSHSCLNCRIVDFSLWRNPRHVIAPPINRWQCSVCDAEGKSGSRSTADPCKEEGCCNHGSNLGRWQLGCKWAAAVEAGRSRRRSPQNWRLTSFYIYITGI